MRERGINLPQIQSVLRSGKVVQVEQDIRRGQVPVAGRDRNLEIVGERKGRGIVTVIDATALAAARGAGECSEDRAAQSASSASDWL